MEPIPIRRIGGITGIVAIEVAVEVKV